METVFTKDMTNEIRTARLTEAKANAAAARIAFDSAKTAKARNLAAEDLEFWGNKVANLGCHA